MNCIIILLLLSCCGGNNWGCGMNSRMCCEREERRDREEKCEKEERCGRRERERDCNKCDCAREEARETRRENRETPSSWQDYPSMPRRDRDKCDCD